MITALIKRIAGYLDENRVPYPVNFASREDVIIHKMVAGRAVDLEDVRHILARSRQRIDLPYIRRWLSEFSGLPEHERIGEDFERLIEG